jgi:hypothetical protein
MCFSCIWQPSKGSFTTEKNRKKVRGQAPLQNTCASRIPITRWREATRCFLRQTILSTTCVCDSFFLLPHPSPPCPPPLPTTAPQLRCDLRARPKWEQSSNIEGGTHTIVAKRREKKRDT